MSCFALDESCDLYLSGGQIAVVEEVDFLVQKITTHLLTYMGEWWLNETYGTPWFQRILVSPADPANAEQELKRIILSTEGVTAITSMSSTFSARTREWSMTFAADTIYGPSGSVTING